MNENQFRGLPSVNTLLDHPSIREEIERVGRPSVVEAAREVLDRARAEIARGSGSEGLDALAVRLSGRLYSRRPSLRRVINATGILLHTGLGRAPLSQAAVDAIARVAGGYCDLELDLEANSRGRRTEPVADLLRRLTGAEAATVVNNNAAATVLALRAVAKGREVVVSRGQLVEIGGSYRLPEVFEASGARLVEVGTTNRTRLSDYERVIGPNTAALLRVHASNYRIVGFVESVAVADLANLAHSRGLLMIDDVGSGALRPGLPAGIAADEPTIAGGLAAGADLVLASGDKLLGGPQCGLIVGRRAAIALLESDPLMRAFRVDKLTIAALAATLELALDPNRAALEIPLWAFLNTPIESLRSRAEAIAASLREGGRYAAEAVASEAELGGGSAPAVPIPSAAIRLTPPFSEPDRDEGGLARRLRLGDPAILVRVHRGAVWIDLRAIPPAEDDEILDALDPGRTGPSGVS